MNVGVGVMYSWFYDVSDLSVKHLPTGKTDESHLLMLKSNEVSPLREGNAPIEIYPLHYLIDPGFVP